MVLKWLRRVAFVGHDCYCANAVKCSFLQLRVYHSGSLRTTSLYCFFFLAYAGAHVDTSRPPHCRTDRMIKNNKKHIYIYIYIYRYSVVFVFAMWWRLPFSAGPRQVGAAARHIPAPSIHVHRRPRPHIFTMWVVVVVVVVVVVFGSQICAMWWCLPFIEGLHLRRSRSMIHHITLGNQ